MSKIDNQLKQMSHELQILTIKLKEKDQEVKLNDLKIKELKKQVPNTRIKPLSSSNKTNLSMDNKRAIQEQDDEDIATTGDRNQAKPQKPKLPTKHKII